MTKGCVCRIEALHPEVYSVSSVLHRGQIAGLVFFLACSLNLAGQVSVTGRVVDEHGAGVASARIVLRPAETGLPVVASSDLAGNFKLSIPGAGDFTVRVERQGFYLYQSAVQSFGQRSELVVTLNHLQEFADHIDVTASAPAVDPNQPADRKELDHTEIQTIPFPAPQDYRNALPMMDGIVQDNAGRAHFNGGQISQTKYTLDGFNMSDPVTGRLETRVNLETIQAMEVATSRFSADNGRGSAGVLNVVTRMGDDRL